MKRKEKRIVAIIQARMGSTRLPGKVLEKIGGKSLLEILVNRLKTSKLLDEIVVATTTNSKDDVIAELTEKLGIKCYRGSEWDVLRRYVESARLSNADIVVRVTADNPLTDVKLMEKLIKKHMECRADYTYCSNIPLGIGSEIINLSALELADKNARLHSEREHVTLYIKYHPEIFKIQNVKSNLGNTNFRLTVDTKEDLELMRVIYKNLGSLDKLQTKDIIYFLKQHPEFCKINAHIKQKTFNHVNEEKVKVSVIIRTHNSANFIKNAIESVLNQTLPQEFYEILVVDDGSTDGTKEILKSYGDKIIIIEKENIGPVRAANIGIKNSRGKYIILLDSDDTFEPTILEELLEVIEKNKVDFVYCDYYEKDVETGEIKIISLKDNIFMSVASGILFRKKILEEMGGYDENLIFPEYDLLIKLIKQGYKHKHIPKPLFTYNRRKGSLTSDKNLVKKGFKQLFDKYGKIKGLRNY